MKPKTPVSVFDMQVDTNSPAAKSPSILLRIKPSHFEEFLFSISNRSMRFPKLNSEALSILRGELGVAI